MKKILSVFLVFMLLVSLLVGCGNSSSSTSEEPKDGETKEEETNDGETNGKEVNVEKKQVYLFIKNRGDLSYWDSMAEGGDRAAVDFADKADVHVIETTADLQANLTAMYEAADAGADLIMTAGDYKDNFVEVATQYPEIAMVIMGDNSISKSENIYGFDFQTSQASFLAGIVAADVASQGLEGTSGSKTIGFIGGMDESIVIQEFFLGYIQGAKYYDPETTVFNNYVGGWNDPETARTQAVTQYNDAKVDIIFACAGGSGNGVHTAAADMNKFVIGVDSDQSLMYENDKDIQSQFVTSVLKLNNNAVYNTMKRFLDEGSLPYGTYDILGLEAEAVGLVENDLFNSYVSDKGMEMLEKAEQGITDGSIEVVGALGKEQAEIKSLIDQFVNQ